MAVEVWKKLEEGGLRFVKEVDIEPSQFIENPLLITKDITDLVNIYYTLSHTQRRKSFIKSKFFMFDIDDLDFNQPVEDTARIAVQELGLNWDETMVVVSGNGIQIVIEIPRWIEDPSWFRERKKAYDNICKRIDKALKEQGLQGECDTTVFEPMRLARIPGTVNEKTKDQRKIVKNARTLQGKSVPVDFDFGAIEPAVASESAVYNWNREVDIEGITSEKGCLVLEWAGVNQTQVDEPLWHALLGIIAAFPKDSWREWVQKFFGSYPGFDMDENLSRLERWREQDGPVTCAKINSHSDKCQMCPHFQKVRRPIDIESTSFVRTKNTGFRFLREDGGPGKIDFYGLCKYYIHKEGLVVTKERELLYSWNKTHWIRKYPAEIKNYAFTRIKPAPSVHQTAQFLQTLSILNLKSENFFSTAGKGRINFKNGVLNTKTKEILPHHKKYGFNYVIPIDLEPRATSPKFREYLLNLMDGDEDLTTLVMEYIGYALSGDRPWANKAMMFEGTGANGKSALIELIKKALGRENVSYITLNKFQDEQSLANIEGKLLNVSSENEASAFRRGTETFKALVAGESIEVKEVYVKKAFITPFAKHIFACNEIPYSYDNSYGFNRRLFLIPFRKRFTGKDANINIVQEMEKEIPGMIMDCLDLYMEARKREAFTRAQASVELGQRYETENSPIRRFIEEEVTDASGLHVTRTQLYDKFLDMCEDEKIRPFGKNKFLKDFRNQYPRELKEAQVRVNGKRERIFEDLTLTSIEERY